MDIPFFTASFPTVSLRAFVDGCAAVTDLAVLHCDPTFGLWARPSNQSRSFAADLRISTDALDKGLEPRSVVVETKRLQSAVKGARVKGGVTFSLVPDAVLLSHGGSVGRVTTSSGSALETPSLPLPSAASAILNARDFITWLRQARAIAPDATLTASGGEFSGECLNRNGAAATMYGLEAEGEGSGRFDVAHLAAAARIVGAVSDSICLSWNRNGPLAAFFSGKNVYGRFFLSGLGEM